jgi:TldD protein
LKSETNAYSFKSTRPKLVLNKEKNGKMSSDIARKGLDEAIKSGATYADVRIGEILDENLRVRNGAPEGVRLLQTSGFGIRVLAEDAWGFAASLEITRSEVTETARKAVAIAKASAKAKRKAVALSKGPAGKAEYSTPIKRDPFKMALNEKMEVLMDAERLLAGQSPLIKSSYGFFRARREKKFFVSTEGAQIRQQITWCGGGIRAIALKNGQAQIRSYGNFSTGGHEFFESLRLSEHAEGTGKEAVRLLDAEKCPSKVTDLITTGQQLHLQIHESCGHPTELDRALGMEADYAGTSFLTPNRLGKFKYGSKLVNIVADATIPGGLGTFGFDDEGTPGKKVYLIKDGTFVGYQSSRETAAALDLKESSGGMRADSPMAIPLIRMTNVNLLPGKWKAEEIIEDTKDGILMETNKSWSIDDRRLNFQFGTEVGWIVRKGRREKMVKNPTYTGITPTFWGGCNAISQDDWMMWGTSNCAKGVPAQVMYVGHGCSTARFEKTRVGLIE